MAFDLAISESGDLLVSAARDLQGASGAAIIPQRIQLRLRLHRGTWIYDPEGRLGSNLPELFGMEPEIAATRVNGLVREALRDMTDIEISDVVAQPEEKSITVIVYYRIIFSSEDETTSSQSDIESVGITIPLGG